VKERFYGTSHDVGADFNIRDTLSPMKLSVSIITYNHERFIAQALESVLAQRVNFEYEIVIGEDCSTDGTRAIIMDYHHRYPGLIIPLTRDQNIGGARNIESTLAACRGRYLAMLEGDDYWTCEDKLQKQVDFLDAHPDYAICCHRVQILDEIGAFQADVFPPHSAGPYTLNDLLKGNFIMTCTTVSRREALVTLSPSFQKLAPLDWARFAIIATHGRIALMDEVMAAYRVHTGSSWSSLPYVTRLREGARMLRALDRHLGFQYTDTIRQTITRPYLDLAVKAQRNRDRAEAAKRLVDCLRNGGWRLSGNRRTLAALAAYVLVGSWYKVFSRARSVSRSE
jgi:glycosyltransferase involved in cell wall biosynthesis